VVLAASAGDRPSVFRWETLREVGPHTLPFKEPVSGLILEVELTSGHQVNVFRANDGAFYFCHGLTFGGKKAPGGPVSPFSGIDVRSIIDNHYQLVDPESAAAAGDVLVWTGPSGETPHSAILIGPAVHPGTGFLDYRCQLLSKNGKLPEATLTLEELVNGPGGYGETYRVYRRQ
jgi:hypothetical protein